MTELPPVTEEKAYWLLNVDGSSNVKGSGAGVILEGPGDITLEQSIRFEFKTSNKQVEYEALIAWLRLARDLGVRNLRCKNDSQLVASQMNGEYQTREPLLQKYYDIARNLTLQFDEVHIIHVPCTENDRANLLSKLASSKKAGQFRMLIQETLHTPSWDHEDVFEIQTGEGSWMTPIVDFLSRDVLPEDKLEAKKIRRHAALYTFVNGELFRRGFSASLLKCLECTQARLSCTKAFAEYIREREPWQYKF